MPEPRECASMKHGGHMCQLKKKGCSREMEELATGARFRCANCGSVARVEENLCRPESI